MIPYMYDLKIDFYNDWIQRLRNTLVSLGYNPPNSPEEVSFQYFNLLRRLVSPIPRRVLFSKEFTCRNDLREGLELIIEKIEKGIDLKPHLSSNIFDLEYDDDLLNDWGIHHLHLGTKIREKDGLIERTGPLLFVRFDNQFAYFINVMKHGSWANQDMVRIIHKNWPNSIKDFRLKVDGVNPKPTNKDIRNLRRARANSVIEIEKGVIYAPLGMGMATSGISMDVVRTSDYYTRVIRDYEDWVKKNITEIVDIAANQGVKLGQKLHFRLGIEKEDIYAFEVNARVFIKLGPIM